MRITPACAGKRMRRSYKKTASWDHPRMCGEKQLLLYRRNARLGSPPHVRGKGAEGAEPAVHHGITPACAGKRSFCPCLQRSCWDHPRMCGEKTGNLFIVPHRGGSPPHVRGKARLCGRRSPLHRITPACAGKRTHGLSALPRVQDHPRMCGEKAAYPVHVVRVLGSPPHVRGKGKLCQ